MKNKKFKFDVIIGNPPYQEEQKSTDIDSSKKNYAVPIYNLFMEEAYKIGHKVELIHPARFLFNAGSTPKKWNKEMLNNPHLKVMYYESNSKKIFSNVDIKGGVAVTYYDDDINFGAIKIFTPYPELNSIRKKVTENSKFISLINIVYSRTSYRLTDLLHKDYPDAINNLSKGHAHDMSSNIFDRLPFIFHDEKPTDKNDYVKIIGRENNRRCWKYIRRDYINSPENFESYKVLVPQATGRGNFGEALPEMIIGKPHTASTETFISIGNFNSYNNAECLMKYIKTKFLRAMLGILKVTQIGNRPVWRLIPLQDFTKDSDIDWSQSISGIDQQLYKKYDLNEEEINFIETKVKEMD